MPLSCMPLSNACFWKKIKDKGRDENPTPIQDCASYIQSISFAIKDEGIALAERALLQKELASNQLIPVSPDTQETEECYFANRPVSVEMQRLIKCLMP